MSEARDSTARWISWFYQSDYRRVARQILQPLGVIRRRLVAPVGRPLPARHLRTAIEPVPRRFEIGSAGDAAQHRPLGREAQSRHHHLILRIGHGQHQRIRGQRQRDRPDPLQIFAADFAGQYGRRRVVRRPSQSEARETGQRIGQIPLRD